MNYQHTSRNCDPKLTPETGVDAAPAPNQRLEWETKSTIAADGLTVPVSQSLAEQSEQPFGIRRDSTFKQVLKRIFWPLKKLHDDWFVDGFIDTSLGRLIRKYYRPGDTVLDIGCGDMSAGRYFPAGVNYNVLDIMYSGFKLTRATRKYPGLNPVIASAESIPAADNSVSFILTAQTLTFIDDIDAVLREITRISTPDARLVVSFSNENCTKYQHKGENPETVHKWRYDEFADLMERAGFRLLERHMKGSWIPLPNWGWLKTTSYHLPVARRREEQNVNFFYVFERNTGEGDIAGNR